MKIPNLSDIPELTIMPEGEYDLKIISVKDTKSARTGRTGTTFVCKIIGEENAHNVFHKIWYPMDGEDQQRTETMWRMVKEFCEALGFDTSSEFEVEDMNGTEFTALLKVDNFNGQDKNEIVRVV